VVIRILSGLWSSAVRQQDDPVPPANGMLSRTEWNIIPETQETTMPADGSERSAVRRSLMVLDCFLGSSVERTVTGIANDTGLPPATVHRLLATLIDWGGIERHGRGRYRLSMHLWRLGASVPEARALRDVALPFLEDLYEATHEVVHLAVLDGIEALYLEKISGRRTAAKVSSEVGKRLPLHATGPGKVLLAYSDTALLERILARGLPAITPSTITTERGLRAALAEIRRTGHAVSRDEMTVGTSSVSAPIFGSDGAIVASLAVVGQSGRISPAMLAPMVRVVAASLSRALAGTKARVAE
jgi:DNA-binding IclR family transcriptional regulator